MSMTLAQLMPQRRLPAEVAALPIRDLHLDSRQLHAGDLFMAVPGEQADGRRFIDAAIGAGAVAVMAEADTEALESRQGVPVLGVPGLRDQAGELAARFFGEPGHGLLVVAVTGTNGKTSVTWFLRNALDALARPCGLIGTLGLFFGDQASESTHTTPDVVTVHRALAGFRDQGAAAVVMEASSHALAQNRLDGVDVDAAVFTNLSHEHLDYHGSMEAYFAAKALLFTRGELSLAVINGDDECASALLDSLADSVTRATFGEGADNDVRFRDFVAEETGMRFVLELDGESLPLRLPLFGRFNLQNILAVAATLRGLGYAAAELEKALGRLTPVPGRMEPVTASGGPRVLVDYAHTHDALEKALTAAREHFSGRLVCVVGCGGDRDTAKRPLMAAAAERLADQVILTADNPRSESVSAIIDEMLTGIRDRSRVQVEPDRSAAIRQAVNSTGEHDVVLVAGKGHEAWQEIAGEKIPMDDRQLAADALAARGGAA